MNTVWHLRLLGGLRAERGGETVTRFRSQKFGALFAYLALFPQRVHTREELADLLWPDAEPEAARTNLRTALSSLRKQLEPPGTPAGSVLVTSGHGQVGLNPAAFETDVAAFEKALKAAARPATSPDETARLLADAADRYAGPLLPGYYETWALTERDRLAEAHLDALRRLVAYHEQAGEPERALGFARRAVSADPLSEEAHAEVIRLLMAMGQPGAARRKFDELARLLDEQLSAEPSPETRALLDAKAAPPPRTPAPREAAFGIARNERVPGGQDEATTTTTTR
jgi:DNA-binding SARP family transcriptional activator